MVFRFETHHTAGLQATLPTSPLGVFSLFFTTTFLQFIDLHTNQYALECMGGEKYAQWTQVTVPELQAYMGFMILMGIVHLPDYWKKDEILHYSPVASRISRDRSLNFIATFTLLITAAFHPQVIQGTINSEKLGQ